MNRKHTKVVKEVMDALVMKNKREIPNILEDNEIYDVDPFQSQW